MSGEKQDVKAQFLAVLTEVEHSIDQSEELLHTLRDGLEHMLTMAYQANKELQNEYQGVASKTGMLHGKFPATANQEAIVGQLDSILSDLNTFNAKQQELHKKIGSTNLVQLLLGDKELAPQKDKLDSYINKITGSVEKGIQSNMTALTDNVAKEKESIRLAMTFITPSELKEQRDDLLAVLQHAKTSIDTNLRANYTEIAAKKEAVKQLKTVAPQVADAVEEKQSRKFGSS